MRILYHSAAPWVNTGYGRCTREIATYLHNKGHEVAIQSLTAVSKDKIMWHGDNIGKELKSPIPVYPTSSIFGLNEIEKHFKQHNADILFTHFDTWMGAAKNKIPRLGIPYMSYVIVDHDPAPNAVVEQVLNSQRTVCMSKYAKKKLEEKGVRPSYIPHGVHTDKYYPIGEDGDKPTAIEVKTEEGDMRKINLEDTFMFGMVAANYGNRKYITGQMQAFNMFLDEVDSDAIIYIHTQQNSDEGYNLEEVRKEIGIPKQNIMWPQKDMYHNIGDGVLNSWYNSFDVMLNCSMGESWGLTITEAQSAGVPCIVNDFSSMPEQLGADIEDMVYEDNKDTQVKEYPHGLAVEPSISLFMQKVSAKQYICNPHDILQAMKIYYENEDLRKEHGEKAREFVVENYNWESEVLPQFNNLFNEMEKMIR